MVYSYEEQKRHRYYWSRSNGDRYLDDGIDKKWGVSHYTRNWYAVPSIPEDAKEITEKQFWDAVVSL